MSPRRHGFGLFRVRSPLLTESLFIFSSYGYLDVSVPHVRLPYGMAGLQPAGLPHSDIPGSTAICASPGFSQLITSFVASESQGIHRLPLLTFSHLVHTYGLIYLKLALLVSSFDVQHVKDPLSSRDVVENNGFEPLTLCVQGRCSSQLS